MDYSVSAKIIVLIVYVVVIAGVVMYVIRDFSNFRVWLDSRDGARDMDVRQMRREYEAWRRKWRKGR